MEHCYGTIFHKEFGGIREVSHCISIYRHHTAVEKKRHIQGKKLSLFSFAACTDCLYDGIFPAPHTIDERDDSCNYSGVFYNLVILLNEVDFQLNEHRGTMCPSFALHV